jgi:hypothetical protein
MLIRLAIVSVIVLEILWALAPRNLSEPKSPETIQAIQAYQTNPSAATRSTMLGELHRDVSYNERRGLILLGVMLVADIVAIYFFWNYRVTKLAA